MVGCWAPNMPPVPSAPGLDPNKDVPDVLPKSDGAVVWAVEPNSDGPVEVDV